MIRPPTEIEQRHIAEFLERENQEGDGLNAVGELVSRELILVTDHYMPDGPGYVGPVFVIIYPASPEVHDVLIYIGGTLVKAWPWALSKSARSV